jgi:hypothetical protein
MVMFADNIVMGWEVFVIVVGALMAIGAYVGYRCWNAWIGGDHGGDGGGY